MVSSIYRSLPSTPDDSDFSTEGPSEDNGSNRSAHNRSPGESAPSAVTEPGEIVYKKRHEFNSDDEYALYIRGQIEVSLLQYCILQLGALVNTQTKLAFSYPTFVLSRLV